MNAPETWPTADDAAKWHDDYTRRPLTPEEVRQEQLREEYERAAIADANSAADFAANVKRYAR